MKTLLPTVVVDHGKAPMSTRRFFIAPETIKTGTPEILGSEARHMARVLRLSKGDTVELFDGSGSGYRAQIVSATPNQIKFRILVSFPLPSESPIQITLAQGFLKDRKMDELIRPLTELGIHRWIPFFSSRSVPCPDKNRLQKRSARWGKIAIEAAKQCKRGRIPHIEPALALDDVLKASEQTALKLLFHEEAGKGFEEPIPAPAQPNAILVIVGPEGGFTADEVERARSHGFVAAGMGPRILRAQTAAIAACTLVQYLYGDMGNR